MSIDIANESGVAVDEVGLAAVARFTLDQMRIHPLAELSVLLVDERTMTELHERWMGEPGPTDVLAFPMDELRPPHLGGNRAGDPEPGDEPGLLGDVVLCPQVATEQAREGWSLRPGRARAAHRARDLAPARLRPRRARGARRHVRHAGSAAERLAGDKDGDKTETKTKEREGTA